MGSLQRETSSRQAQRTSLTGFGRETFVADFVSKVDQEGESISHCTTVTDTDVSASLMLPGVIGPFSCGLKMLGVSGALSFFGRRQLLSLDALSESCC